MKTYLLPALLTIFSAAHSQESVQITTPEEISAMEQRSWQNAFSSARMVSATSSSQNFDIKYYRCEWEVDPAVRFISGTVTAHFVMKSAGDVIAFDLADNLTVSAVKQKNISIPFDQANHTLTINFPSALATGAKDSVSITYQGAPVDNGSFVVTTHGSAATLSPLLWTLSEPFGSRDWWPCKNGLDDKADSIDVYVTHPSAYKAASNGLMQGQQPIAGGKTVTHWKHRYPIASYLVCLAVTNYTVMNNSVSIGADNIAMQTFCYPESQVSFQAGALNAMQGLTFYSNLFGMYPFKNEKYGHVQFGWGGGMEHQTNSFMVNMNEGLIAHELAHQWFGDKITCGSWEDIWLNEGFATHLASMYMEDKYPANAKTTRINEINSITSAPGGSVQVDDVTNVGRIFSTRLSYFKGSHLLYMLRWILGDAIFKTALQNYLADPALAYGFAATANLKNHLEAASGKDLTYFFDQWYSGQGYPSYQVEWFPFGNSVQVKLKQTTSHASVGFFQLPVPLLFRNSVTSQQKLVVLDNTFNGQTFNEDLGFEPNEVIFDPDVWLITKNNTLTKATNPLPVTFAAFQADCSEGQVVLSWETSEEINADHFEVERSTDAVHWSIIGLVDAAGDSKVHNTYVFNDDQTGTNRRYYRIVEVDRDGARQHTRILSSSCTVSGESGPGDFKITLAPNPVKGRLIFETEGPAPGEFTASVYNLNGQVVDTGLNNVPVHAKNDINVSSLAAGLYILAFKTKDHKRVGSVRFLKE